MVAVLATVACLLPAAPARADAVRDAEWYLGFLKITEVHQITQGEGVTVAVVDTGVDSHPDLDGNVLPGGDVTIGGTDGREDLVGHGTAMAGLIAAHGRGSSGILGIAPKARILPVRNDAGGKTGGVYVDGGIRWAVQHGAKVICASYGAPNSAEARQEVQDALSHDVVIVAAVGNRPEVTTVAYPAAYPGVVAAAGVDRAGNHTDISVAGQEVVLAAPAADVISTGEFGKYSTGQGTSNATAIIAGAAALVRAKYPQLSAREVIHRLTATADDKGPPGRDPEYGYGVLNIVAALTADVPPLPASPSPAGAQPSISTPSSQATRPDNGTSPVVLILVGLGLLLVAAAGATTYLLRRNRQ
jgi:type VII secretion-associated serine protease mycosin